MAKLVLLATATTLLLLPGTADAQAYPSKPIRLIVPSAPGGGPDVTARLMANELTKQMEQQVVVDNRPGADTIIGTQAIARAAPDGYTLGLLTNSFTTNRSLFAKLPYDSDRDFQPIVLSGSVPFLLAVTPSLAVRSVKELIDHARANPGKLLYGNTGAGTAGTLSMELLKLQTGTNIIAVSYKGAPQAITEAIGGQIHIICDNMSILPPHVRSARLRGLGVTSLKRSPIVPDLPTIDEAGIAGYEVTASAGYAAPAGVPREIVMRLNREINRALQSPAVTEKTTASGATILGGTPQQYAEHLRADTAKWAKVIKAAGITPQ
jgi:tripartite-type tricarboxylate transporter receptor subunit TctC